MMQVIDCLFNMKKDRNASWNIEGAFVSKCLFDNCFFSNESADGRRSVIKNVSAERCKFIGCQIGPGAFLDCHLKDSTATDLVIFWGSIFEHVTFSGRIPTIKINTYIDSVPDPDMQALYDRDRASFYEKIDWAIDISNARFTLFEVRGIPARLLKLDGATQAVVRRENLKNVSEISDLETNAWFPWIISFFHNKDPELVLAAPLSKPKAKRDRFLAGLAELREIGIADPA